MPVGSLSGGERARVYIARLMLERSDASDLGAVYQRTIGDLAVEDPDRENGLLRTLEVYCETFATTRTAERLGIHRNTLSRKIGEYKLDHHGSRRR